MSTTTTTTGPLAELEAESPAEELARIRAKFPKWSAGRVLSAIGHPGYGSDHAGKVLAIVAELAAYGVSAGDVLYGSVAYRQARLAQDELA